MSSSEAPSSPTDTPAPSESSSSSSSTSSSSSSSSSGAAATPAADVPPNHTLYCNNLNEKIKLDELKKSLYHVFSQFGNILEIYASKRLKSKGQAWIVFDDLSGATKALREMNDFIFYGKPMRVGFAKAKSDIVSKIDGTFTVRPKRKPDEPKEKKKGEKKKATTTPGSSGDASKRKKQKTDDGESKGEGKSSSNGSNSSSDVAPSAFIPPSVHEAPAPPNKILFVENLPPQCNAMMLAMLFDKYHGYTEARMVPGKPGIAFVEFADHYQAGVAREGLQGFRITPTIQMKISFAKK